MTVLHYIRHSQDDQAMLHMIVFVLMDDDGRSRVWGITHYLNQCVSVDNTSFFPMLLFTPDFTLHGLQLMVDILLFHTVIMLCSFTISNFYFPFCKKECVNHILSINLVSCSNFCFCFDSDLATSVILFIFAILFIFSQFVK